MTDSRKKTEDESEICTAPERKDVLKNTTLMELCSRNTGANWKYKQWPNLDNKKKKKKALGFNLKYKYPWVQTDINTFKFKNKN